MPLVTVGLPFFDEAQYLGEAIRSVLAQSITDFELILVDDGSRDDSLAIARSFADPRIRVLGDGERRHLPARLNEIVREARAPFVARMDADDVMHPTRLARQLAAIEAEPKCDAVGSWAALVDREGHPFGVVENGRIPPSRKSVLVHGVVPHATLFARRAWFVDNPYNASLTRAEDRDLWCRTLGSQFAVVPECLYVIRVDVSKESFLASYLESQRQNRLIYAEYGPRFVGRLETLRLVAVAEAKSVVMRLAFDAGLGERLVRRRGRPPTPYEARLAREALFAAQPA